MADIQAFFDPKTSTVTYLVADPVMKRAAIIDPAADFDPASARLGYASIDAILDVAASRGLKIEWALDTHAHADHLSAADYIRRKTGARVGIGARITEVQKVFGPLFNARDVTPDGGAFDQLWEDNASFQIGSLNVRCSAYARPYACLRHLCRRRRCFRR